MNLFIQVLLLCFTLISCKGGGEPTSLTFSVDCVDSDCRNESLNNKNYFFLLTELEDCEDIISTTDSGEYTYDASKVLYMSSSVNTGQRSICSNQGCDFSINRFYDNNGVEQSEFTKGISLSAIAWIDTNANSLFDDEDVLQFQCIDNGEAVILDAGENVIRFDELRGLSS